MSILTTAIIIKLKVCVQDGIVSRFYLQRALSNFKSSSKILLPPSRPQRESRTPPRPSPPALTADGILANRALPSARLLLFLLRTFEKLCGNKGGAGASSSSPRPTSRSGRTPSRRATVLERAVPDVRRRAARRSISIDQGGRISRGRRGIFKRSKQIIVRHAGGGTRTDIGRSDLLD